MQAKEWEYIPFKWYFLIFSKLKNFITIIQDVVDPFQMVTHNGQNLTLTPGIAQQVAALPVMPLMPRAANQNVNSEAGPSRNQVCFLKCKHAYLLSLISLFIV